MHLVLVEDGPHDRELISQALVREGVRVTVCATDAEFYGLLDRKGVNGVDALIADIDLGEGTTGFDVARAARRHDQRLPVIYITSSGVKAGPHKVDGGVLLRKTQDPRDLAQGVLGALRARGLARPDHEPSDAVD